MDCHVWGPEELPELLTKMREPGFRHTQGMTVQLHWEAEPEHPDCVELLRLIRAAPFERREDIKDRFEGVVFCDTEDHPRFRRPFLSLLFRWNQALFSEPVQFEVNDPDMTLLFYMRTPESVRNYAESARRSWRQHERIYPVNPDWAFWHERLPPLSDEVLAEMERVVVPEKRTLCIDMGVYDSERRFILALPAHVDRVVVYRYKLTEHLVDVLIERRAAGRPIRELKIVEDTTDPEILAKLPALIGGVERLEFTEENGPSGVMSRISLLDRLPPTTVMNVGSDAPHLPPGDALVLHFWRATTFRRYLALWAADRAPPARSLTMVLSWVRDSEPPLAGDALAGYMRLGERVRRLRVEGERYIPRPLQTLVEDWRGRREAALLVARALRANSDDARAEGELAEGVLLALLRLLRR